LIKPHGDEEEDNVMRFIPNSSEDTDGDDDYTNVQKRTRRPPHPKPKSTYFTASAYFSNLQTRISDPSVFNPPSYCGNSTVEWSDEDDSAFVEIPAVLERFVSF